MEEETPVSSMNAIRRSLQSNSRLKKLGLTFGSVFDEDFSSEINFKLTNFKVSRESSESHSLQNLSKFLMLQSNCLETLEVSDWSATVMAIKTFLPTSKVTKLCLNGYEDEDYRLNHFEIWPQSNSVTDLDLSDFSSSTHVFELLLKCFPKVETLKIDKLSDKKAKIIAETCHSLRKLMIEEFAAVNITNKDFYLNLEKILLSRCEMQIS